jgi:hypothetical protein
MGKLQDLDVDRIDVVGKPATRKRFLLLKDADGKVRKDDGADPAAAVADPPERPKPDPEPEPAEPKPERADKASGALVEKFMALVQSLDGVALSSEQEALIQEILAEMDRAAEAKSVESVDQVAEVIAEKVALALSAAGVPAAIVKAQQTRSQRILASRQGKPTPEPIRRSAGPRKMGEGLFMGALFGESSR